jgi:hypothetical protein
MAVSAARNVQLPRYVENRHIDHIPAGAWYGKPWHQFAFWLGSNVNVFNVVVGAVIVSIGLTFWPALIAIAVGTLMGALLIALHATQGPRLGVPQRLQPVPHQLADRGRHRQRVGGGRHPPAYQRPGYLQSEERISSRGRVHPPQDRRPSPPPPASRRMQTSELSPTSPPLLQRTASRNFCDAI